MISTSTFRSAAAVAVLLLSCALAQAQSSDAQRELARELLQTLRLTAQIERTMTVVADKTTDFMRQSRPQMSAEEAKAYGEIYAGELKSRTSELVEEIANLYAKEYSADDLKQIIGFYKSPIGQKYLDTQPKLTASGASLGKAWEDTNEEEVLKAAAEKMRKRGYKGW